MEVIAANPSESEAQLWNDLAGKRIRGRFRATLAGLLELEMLRVGHKRMVEMALGKPEGPDESDLLFQQGRSRYLVEESSTRLKLKRSSSNKNVIDAGKSRTFVSWEKTGVHRSSGDLRQLGGWSRASSGFCEGNFHSCAGIDVVGSLSTSLASLSYSCDVGDAGCREKVTFTRQLSNLPRNRRERRWDELETRAFSKVVVPDAGFLSVIDMYPDSHWPDLSDILLPQVVLEPSYLSDLRSCQGSEVYRYPSPLHAVALQSPLYAPLSPTKNRKRNEAHSSGSAPSRSSSLAGQDCAHGRRASEGPSWHSESFNMLRSSSPLNPHVHSENDTSEDVVLKRAQGQLWSQAALKTAQGVPSWSKMSVSSIYRTLSVDKSRASFQSVHLPNRAFTNSESEPSSCMTPSHAGFGGRLGTRENRLRRHTAALTNLSIYRKGQGTLCLYSDRQCITRASDEKDT